MKKRRERRVAIVKVTLTKDECVLLEKLCSGCDDAGMTAKEARSIEIKLFRARRFAARRVPVR